MGAIPPKGIEPGKPPKLNPCDANGYGFMLEGILLIASTGRAVTAVIGDESDALVETDEAGDVVEDPLCQGLTGTVISMLEIVSRWLTT